MFLTDSQAFFAVYTIPLGDRIRKHKLNFHIFADGKQLYILFKPTPEMSAITRSRSSMHLVGANLVCTKFSQVLRPYSWCLTLGSS